MCRSGVLAIIASVSGESTHPNRTGIAAAVHHLRGVMLYDSCRRRLSPLHPSTTTDKWGLELIDEATLVALANDGIIQCG
jgi:hypothetical protein